jgi:hypothetical protein
MAAAMRSSSRQPEYGVQTVTVVRQSNGWAAKGIGAQLGKQQPQGIDALVASLEQRGIVRMTIEL